LSLEYDTNKCQVRYDYRITNYISGRCRQQMERVFNRVQ